MRPLKKTFQKNNCLFFTIIYYNNVYRQTPAVEFNQAPTTEETLLRLETVW
jgi:hypothetical protein